MVPSRLAVIVLTLFLSIAGADEPDAGQSAKLPTPEWLKLGDLGKQDGRLKGYVAPLGIKLEIVAEAPTVINPVAMTFAEDGTPLVVEWLPAPDGERETPVEFKYKDGSKRTFLTISKKVKDVVKALRDSKGKGVFDEAKVVLEEELPSTVLAHNGWLYVASRGSVRRWKRSKDDGSYDVSEVIVQGLGGPGRRQVSGLALGNDGWLYITCGDGDHHAEGADGSRATVLRTGAVFRCRPDGTKLETFALGFRNPYGNVAFDAAFNLFHVDEDPGGDAKFIGCRLLHVSEGNDFGWRLDQGSRDGPDNARATTVGKLPGRLPPLLQTGTGSPGGLLIYNDTFLPDNYRGLLYYPDALRRLVRAYRIDRTGASFKVVEEFEFLGSDDPLFRPCHMTIGPDGAIYVVDRRTASIDPGKLTGSGKGGRIWRITWSGTTEQPAIAPRSLDVWARLRKLSDDELLKALASENASDRRQAQLELVKRGEKQRPGLIKVLEDTDASSPARLAALGALNRFWNAEVAEAMKGRLVDSDPDIRRLAIEALGTHGAAKGTEALGMLDDGEPDVRRAAALALARTASQGVADSIVSAMLADDTKDAVLIDGYDRAIEILGKVGIERLLAEFESGDKKKIDRVADAFLCLRTRPAADAIPRLLTYPHLSVKQRANLVRSYRNYLLDPAVDLAPVLDYLVKHADEALPVKLAGLEVLASGKGLDRSKAEKWVTSFFDSLDAAGATQVGQLYLDRKLPKEVFGKVLELLRRHRATDAEAAQMLAKLLAQGK